METVFRPDGMVQQDAGGSVGGRELPSRCVIVLDKDLPVGKLANAAAVIALTIGQRHPALVGAPLVDASGFAHPGLIPIGVAMLAASGVELQKLRADALAAGCDVVDFPVQGQMTKNYEEFQSAVVQIPVESLQYLGVALIGQKKSIARIVGKLELLA
ncbi:DUF2000 domain-containing protein [Undibacterium terreum]|uniref:DUF2000 domain-containing protein n=1 Tax=Undibacterium terreum TaxID=1224302 RepID=A0A916UUZ4_9BURK|nr:DUF2000 domain-containing protein [Undibacterium terreum]GGC89132.1 hypothetical protein GCM10011396_40430 [Undibacterium terreum]